jgi:hypothetical protein
MKFKALGFDGFQMLKQSAEVAVRCSGGDAAVQEKEVGSM